MSKKLYEESNLLAIANAIRQKNGSSSQYTVGQMPNAILEISTEPDLESLTVNQNGNYLPSSGNDGFSSVEVSVPNSYAAADEGKIVKNSALVAQTTRISPITENGTYDTTENNEIVVSVSGGEPSTLVQKTINQNGTYNPENDNADGYSMVIVNVSGGSGSSYQSIAVHAENKYDTGNISVTIERNS